MSPSAPSGLGADRYRLMNRISDAIKQLGNARGSSAKQIIAWLESKPAAKQVDEARLVLTLKKGVENGILKCRGGRYKLPLRDEDDRELCCRRRRRRRSCRRRRRRSCRRRRRRSCRRRRRRSCCRRRRRRSCRRRRRSCRRRRRRSCRRRRRSCRRRRRSCRRRRRRCSSDMEVGSLGSAEGKESAGLGGPGQQTQHPSQQG